MFLGSINSINRLISKRMSNIYLTSFYWGKLTFSKLRSVFGEHKLTQMPLNAKTSCCNIKIRGLGAKVCA